ncbi:MAG: hypothetical protein IT458_02135 [Planctomycetes bacterium]|nr:hypothetical protein [Planctomycetota bacterium]
MAELELPQISFARYLDLLKRRRWQVVPVSLLGLVIGAVVAFFIPRYYVARTTVQFYGRLDGQGRSVGEDPLAQAVQSAAITIRALVPEALTRLGWPEAMVEDPNGRRAFAEEVRGRLEVNDLGPRERGRTSTNLEIVYRDTNGPRSKELADTLRDVWIRREKELIEQSLRQQIDLVNQAMDTARKTKVAAEKAVFTFEREHQINPEDFLGDRQGEISALSAEIRELERSIATYGGEIDGIDAQLTALRERERSGAVPKEIEQVRTMAPELRKVHEELQFRVAYARSAFESVTPANQRFGQFQRAVEEAERRLKEFERTVGGSPVERIANPEWIGLRNEIRTLELRRESRSADLAAARRLLDEAEKRRTANAVIYRDYRSLSEQRRSAEEEVRRIDRQLAELEARQREVLAVNTYEVLSYAWVPPRPTEPSAFLLAIVGSVLGLAAAIALILLLDVLRTSFKTVEDVERGLAVPVLGGMSHLETEEARRAGVVRRRRISVAAGAFLVLVVSVVTVYYVKPTSLPGFVWKTLDLLLGRTQE